MRFLAKYLAHYKAPIGAFLLHMLYRKVLLLSPTQKVGEVKRIIDVEVTEEISMVCMVETKACEVWIKKCTFICRENSKSDFDYLLIATLFLSTVFLSSLNQRPNS